MKALIALAVVAGTVVPMSAADPDRRLATAKTAFVFPVDPLKDDQPVAACFSEQLTKLTPYTAAEKGEAEILLGVNGDISGDFKKGMGTLGTVSIIASAPDGTLLWKGHTAVLTNEVGTRRLTNTEVACALATEIADKLRGAMRKARDKK